MVASRSSRDLLTERTERDNLRNESARMSASATMRDIRDVIVTRKCVNEFAYAWSTEARTPATIRKLRRASEEWTGRNNSRSIH